MAGMGDMLIMGHANIMNIVEALGNERNTIAAVTWRHVW
jgi:hypothetical protein